MVSINVLPLQQILYNNPQTALCLTEWAHWWWLCNSHCASLVSDTSSGAGVLGSNQTKRNVTLFKNNDNPAQQQFVFLCYKSLIVGVWGRFKAGALIWTNLCFSKGFTCSSQKKVRLTGQVGMPKLHNVVILLWRIKPVLEDSKVTNSPEPALSLSWCKKGGYLRLNDTESAAAATHLQCECDANATLIDAINMKDITTHCSRETPELQFVWSLCCCWVE